MLCPSFQLAMSVEFNTDCLYHVAVCALNNYFQSPKLISALPHLIKHGCIHTTMRLGYTQFIVTRTINLPDDTRIARG